MLSFLKQYITIKNLQKYLSFPYTRQTFKNGWNLAYEGFVNKYVQSLLAIFFALRKWETNDIKLNKQIQISESLYSSDTVP